MGGGSHPKKERGADHAELFHEDTSSMASVRDE
jgi:hypothetical protein